MDIKMNNDVPKYKMSLVLVLSYHKHIACHTHLVLIVLPPGGVVYDCVCLGIYTIMHQ